MKILRYLPAVVLLWVVAAAQAVPVQWSVNGLVRDDGGTVSGSFVYDADTDTYSAVNVTTTGGTSPLPGETYTGFDPSGSDASGLVLQRSQGAGDLTGQNQLLFAFLAPLTNVGGSVTPFLAEEVSCTSADCSTSINAQSLNGSITGALAPSAPVAVPAVPLLGLLFISLGCLLVARRSLIAN